MYISAISYAFSSNYNPFWYKYKFKGHIPETQKLPLLLITLTVWLREQGREGQGREREKEKERKREKKREKERKRKRERERESERVREHEGVVYMCKEIRRVKLNIVKTNCILHTHLFDLVILDLLVHKLKESACKNWTMNKNKLCASPLMNNNSTATGHM